MNRHPFDDPEHHSPPSSSSNDSSEPQQQHPFKPFSGVGRTIKGEICQPSDDQPVERKHHDKDQISLFNTQPVESTRSTSFNVKY